MVCRCVFAGDRCKCGGRDGSELKRGRRGEGVGSGGRNVGLVDIGWPMRGFFVIGGGKDG